MNQKLVLKQLILLHKFDGNNPKILLLITQLKMSNWKKALSSAPKKSNFVSDNQFYMREKSHLVTNASQHWSRKVLIFVAVWPKVVLMRSLLLTQNDKNGYLNAEMRKLLFFQDKDPMHYWTIGFLNSWT